MLLEDEERYARDQIARQQHQQQQQQLRQFPYAQRTTAVTVPQQQQQQQGRGSSPQSPPSQRERDTMADVQDQFTKLAESESPLVTAVFSFDLREEVWGVVADGEVAVVYGTLGRGRRHTHVTYRNDTDAQKQVANGRLAPWYQRSKPKFKNLINQGMLIFTLLFFFWFCYTAATAANSICTCASPSP